tara:strand:- start:524 stop:976 length:453 start_codon:yes stop_codon:yes gene_type:complete
VYGARRVGSWWLKSKYLCAYVEGKGMSVVCVVSERKEEEEEEEEEKEKEKEKKKKRRHLSHSLDGIRPRHDRTIRIGDLGVHLRSILVHLRGIWSGEEEGKEGGEATVDTRYRGCCRRSSSSALTCRMLPNTVISSTFHAFVCASEHTYV